MNACCTGWSAGGFRSPFCFAYHAGRPSSVVIDLPARDPTGVTHERVSTPSTRTEQEPHCARPQPNRGPCKSNSFERTYSRGVSGLEVTCHKRSFTLIFISEDIYQCPARPVFLMMLNATPAAIPSAISFLAFQPAIIRSRRSLCSALLKAGRCLNLQCRPEGRRDISRAARV